MDICGDRKVSGVLAFCLGGTNQSANARWKVLRWDCKHTVHKHVPRRGWKRAYHPIQRFIQYHLTPQPTRVRQPERHIQHVVFIVSRFLQQIVMFR